MKVSTWDGRRMPRWYVSVASNFFSYVSLGQIRLTDRLEDVGEMSPKLYPLRGNLPISSFVNT